MDIQEIPFGVTRWDSVSSTEHRGQAGVAFWRTCQFGNIRVRMVEYSPGYVADHWCEKGHILFCVEGELETELENGERFLLTTGQSYQVGDGVAAHRSRTKTGAKLFIVD
jgi:quercetin dioxygenase-like cupin family protein